MHNYIYIIHIHYTRGLQLISARVKQQVDGCDMLCASMQDPSSRPYIYMSANQATKQPNNQETN